MPPTKIEGVPNLQRGMAVLEYLATNNRAATITELAERLDYPTASVYRITSALAGMGYLARDPASKRYTLTNQMLLLGQPHGRGRGLVESALPAMRGLRKATGETTQLCCMVDRDAVVLEQLLAIHPFKYSVDLGARCPVYSCAPGKAMVAALPDEDRVELIARLRFKKFTETTITSRAVFEKEMAIAARDGFAIDRAEGLEGIHCIAAPILDRNGHPVGAITIAGPSSRIKRADFKRLGGIVTEASAAAEQTYNA